MSEKIVIIGDGAMGTVCALLLAHNGHDVTLWSYAAEHTESLRRDRENVRFLPGVALPESLNFTCEDDAIFEGADLALSAVPCVFLRQVWQRLAVRVPAALPIISVTKGIENETLDRPTEIIGDCVGGRPMAVLSGPNIADELAQRLPASSTVAARNEVLAEHIQNAIKTDWFRIYTNTDVVGVELAGATKNVIAIAAGIIDGLRAGDNAKAGLLTRGLVEISRLGVELGARAETFCGLSGMGDLVTTCISSSGRNRTFGQLIGEGKTVAEALSTIPGEVEGVNTCQSLVALAKKHNVDMPITQAVWQTLFHGKPVAQAISELMSRKPKAENRI